MKNILSFVHGTRLTGKEIKDWIRYHIENSTSHTKIAKTMERFLNVKDDRKYILIKGDYEASEGKILCYRIDKDE